MLITLKIKKIDNKTYERNFSKRVKIWKQNFGRKIMTKIPKNKIVEEIFSEGNKLQIKMLWKEIGDRERGIEKVNRAKGPTTWGCVRAR